MSVSNSTSENRHWHTQSKDTIKAIIQEHHQTTNSNQWNCQRLQQEIFEIFITTWQKFSCESPESWITTTTCYLFLLHSSNSCFLCSWPCSTWLTHSVSTFDSDSYVRGVVSVGDPSHFAQIKEWRARGRTSRSNFLLRLICELLSFRWRGFLLFLPRTFTCSFCTAVGSVIK